MWALFKCIYASISHHGKLTGAPEPDPIFSKKRVEDTLTSGYLEMLGTLSKQKDGIESVQIVCCFTDYLTDCCTVKATGEIQGIHSSISP